MAAQSAVFILDLKGKVSRPGLPFPHCPWCPHRPACIHRFCFLFLFSIPVTPFFFHQWVDLRLATSPSPTPSRCACCHNFSPPRQNKLLCGTLAASTLSAILLLLVANSVLSDVHSKRRKKYRKNTIFFDVSISILFPWATLEIADHRASHPTPVLFVSKHCRRTFFYTIFFHLLLLFIYYYFWVMPAHPSCRVTNVSALNTVPP